MAKFFIDKKIAEIEDTLINSILAPDIPWVVTLVDIFLRMVCISFKESIPLEQRGVNFKYVLKLQRLIIVVDRTL